MLSWARIPLLAHTTDIITSGRDEVFLLFISVPQEVWCIAFFQLWLQLYLWVTDGKPCTHTLTSKNKSTHWIPLFVKCSHVFTSLEPILADYHVKSIPEPAVLSPTWNHISNRMLHHPNFQKIMGSRIVSSLIISSLFSIILWSWLMRYNPVTQIIDWKKILSKKKRKNNLFSLMSSSHKHGLVNRILHIC